MALDWTTAESYTRGLSRDETSRLSTLPRDVVDTVAPYLHMYMHDGYSYRDGKPHGTRVSTFRDYYGIYEMRNNEYNGVNKWWRVDGSMYMYSEYDMGHLLLRIEWLDSVRVYDGEWKHHDTLPDKYRRVWEAMTRSI